MHGCVVMRFRLGVGELLFSFFPFWCDEVFIERCYEMCAGYLGLTAKRVGESWRFRDSRYDVVQSKGTIV